MVVWAALQHGRLIHFKEKAQYAASAVVGTKNPVMQYITLESLELIAKTRTSSRSLWIVGSFAIRQN